MRRRDNTRFRSFARRSVLLGGAQVGLLAALVGRLYYLQVVESDQYLVLAEDNRINLRLLPPPRGRLLDRFGAEIAANRQNFRVVLIPEQTNSVEETLSRLSDLVRIEDYQRTRVLREVERKRKFMPVTVAENLTWEEFARVNVHSPDLPGVQLDVGETRDYPLGPALAHVIGYVAAVSEQELGTDPLLELPGFRIGKSGIEKVYDQALRGKAGDSQVEVNAYGRVIRELARRDGQSGSDLVLTIDSALQRYAVQAMGEHVGAAVVLDVHSGDVLALVSTPAFDPAAFNVGISPDYWRSLTRDKLKPLTNKAIAGQYPPGSTYKMVVALAALESGAIKPDHQVFCTGATSLGNATFHCWKKGGHGTVGVVSALEQSCDCFFYDVARRTGVDRMAELVFRFGLGKPTGIDLAGERPGLIPTRDWKRAVRGEPWHPGETLVVGIGQGYVLATPLQIAVMCARLANGGYAVTPRLLRPGGEVADGDASPKAAERGLKSLNLQPAALAQVLQGMRNVSNSPRGTAFRARIKEPEFALAGKTGTSQVRRISKRERETGIRKGSQKPWEERDHAWFVAYAPMDDPRYACCVLVEHGEGGSTTAAPIVRDILLECQRLDPVHRPGRGRLASGGGRGGSGASGGEG